MTALPTVACVVYRCSRQDEMYLYVKDGVELDELPESLLGKVGRLSQVMSLSLDPARKLARVDVRQVLKRLDQEGWFLQLPPADQVQAHLDDGD